MGVCRQCLPGSGSPRWTSSCVYLIATTVSAWFWISSVQCLPGSGSPCWTSSCVCLTATTVSAWFWISSVDLLLCVPDCYYSLCLALDLLGGPPVLRPRSGCLHHIMAKVYLMICKRTVYGHIFHLSGHGLVPLQSDKRGSPIPGTSLVACKDCGVGWFVYQFPSL